MIAASLVEAQFSSYDEDGNELWVPDGELCLLCYCHILRLLVPNVSYPMSESSALELFSPDFIAVDGYGLP